MVGTPAWCLPLLHAIPALSGSQPGPVMLQGIGRKTEQRGKECRAAQKTRSTTVALSACQEQAVKKRKCSLSEYKGPISLYNKLIYVTQSLSSGAAYMQD